MINIVPVMFGAIELTQTIMDPLHNHCQIVMTISLSLPVLL